MRKSAFLVAAVLVGCFVFGNNLMSASVSAQKQRGPVKTVAADQNSDAEMARNIKKLTDRSSANSTQRMTPSGAIELDLNGGGENVALGRIEDDGRIGAACVASLGEANAFFGRDLETGRSVPKTKFRQPTEAELAAAHGMSQEEFEFYKRLIADAANRPSSASIVIVNNDGAGEGFNDPTAAFVVGEGGNTGTTVGQQRLILFQFAASIWGAFLDSNVTIEVRSQFNAQTCSSSGAVLGSAGSVNLFRDFPNAQFPGTWYHGALANKRSNADQSINPDINATFNSSIDTGCLTAGSRWYYGLDNATPALRINLLVTLLHEMGHGLGFSSTTSGQTGNFNSGFPGVWDRFMFDNATGLFWLDMTPAQRVASAIGNGSLRWDGANVKLASPGYLTGGLDATGRVQLYTPSTFQGGSSVSHFSNAASPNVLMEPAINPGLPIDLDLTRQLMRDIGWYRDSNGDLVPDSITAVTLDGTATIGSTRTVRWINGGGFDRNVTIELSTDGGNSFATPIAVNVANTGSFAFTVPNLPTTNAKIRIREENFLSPLGTSDNFAIGAQAATFTVSGHISSEGGSGVPFAEVLVFDSGDNIIRIVQGNAFGDYVITGLSAGQYSFLASKKRFRFNQEPHNLVGDVQINFTAH